MNDRIPVPFRAINLAGADVRLTSMELNHGVRYIWSLGPFGPPDIAHFPEGDTLTLEVRRGSDGAFVKAVFRHQPPYWICPEMNIGCDEATMDRAINGEIQRWREASGS